VEQVLKQTNNYPDFPFFVQVGGDGSGEVWSQKQLKQPVIGAGSIHVYSLTKYKPQELIKGWVDFFKNESCGQCTPCREGTYRLSEILLEPKPNWQTVADLLRNLNETSFCGLGMSVATPITTYVKNVLSTTSERALNLPAGYNKQITSCFN
ncbi:hypothetical protein HGA64_05550, partial [Candidatus Falkowbacteria bacterium]|nr:hypothetical protein [Candidatus Falkowbacteria bacterium]